MCGPEIGYVRSGRQDTLESEIARIHKREVALASGGSIVIDPTEALDHLCDQTHPLVGIGDVGRNAGAAVLDHDQRLAVIGARRQALLARARARTAGGLPRP